MLRERSREYFRCRRRALVYKHYHFQIFVKNIVSLAPIYNRVLFLAEIFRGNNLACGQKPTCHVNSGFKIPPRVPPQVKDKFCITGEHERAKRVSKEVRRYRREVVELYHKDPPPARVLAFRRERRFCGVPPPVP